MKMLAQLSLNQEMKVPKGMLTAEKILGNGHFLPILKVGRKRKQLFSTLHPTCVNRIYVVSQWKSDIFWKSLQQENLVLLWNENISIIWEAFSPSVSKLAAAALPSKTKSEWWCNVAAIHFWVQKPSASIQITARRSWWAFFSFCTLLPH